MTNPEIIGTTTQTQFGQDHLVLRNPHECTWEPLDKLMEGFRAYNIGLGVTRAWQDTTDSLLGDLADVSPKIAAHSIRVGGYAGVALQANQQFSTPELIGEARIMGAVHDVGKTMVREVARRSEGHGKFDRDRDLPLIAEHAVHTFRMLGRDAIEPNLPQGAKLVGGCHHRKGIPGHEAYGVPLEEIDAQYPDPFKRAFLHRVVDATVVGDVYDASNIRVSTFFGGAEKKEIALRSLVAGLFPHSSEAVIRALVAERKWYVSVPEPQGEKATSNSV